MPWWWWVSCSMQFDEWMAAKPYLSFKQVFWSHFIVLYHHLSISQLLYCMHCDIACGGFNHSLWIISFSSCSVSRPSSSTATFFVPSDALVVSSSEQRQRRGWEASLKSGNTQQMRCVHVAIEPHWCPHSQVKYPYQSLSFTQGVFTLLIVTAATGSHNRWCRWGISVVLRILWKCHRWIPVNFQTVTCNLECFIEFWQASTNLSVHRDECDSC